MGPCAAPAQIRAGQGLQTGLADGCTAAGTVVIFLAVQAQQGIVQLLQLLATRRIQREQDIEIFQLDRLLGTVCGKWFLAMMHMPLQTLQAPQQLVAPDQKFLSNTLVIHGRYPPLWASKPGPRDLTQSTGSIARYRGD